MITDNLKRINVKYKLDKANYSTISKAFDQSMFLLWPEGIHHDDVLLFVTDAVPYMIKSDNSLKALYSKMVHVTCLVHAHHWVAETIRGKFNKVDGLVSNVKKIFSMEILMLKNYINIVNLLYFLLDISSIKNCRIF